jgi:hypothetical protein
MVMVMGTIDIIITSLKEADIIRSHKPIIILSSLEIHALIKAWLVVL